MTASTADVLRDMQFAARQHGRGQHRKEDERQREAEHGCGLFQLGDRMVDPLQQGAAAGAVWQLIRQSWRQQQGRDEAEDLDMPPMLQSHVQQ